MLQFIESIKLLNGKFFHLELHQERLNHTRKVFFPGSEEIDLTDLLTVPDNLAENQVYKYRIIYDSVIRYFSHEPYIPANPGKLIFKEIPEAYNYSYKYENRQVIQELKSQVKQHDDIILVKNGIITDASSANLVFSDGKKYYTPATPLLKGIKRSFYIGQGLLIEEEIKTKDISRFREVYLISAMRDIQEYPAISASCCIF